MSKAIHRLPVFGRKKGLHYDVQKGRGDHKAIKGHQIPNRLVNRTERQEAYHFLRGSPRVPLRRLRFDPSIKTFFIRLPHSVFGLRGSHPTLGHNCTHKCLGTLDIDNRMRGLRSHFVPTN